MRSIERNSEEIIKDLQNFIKVNTSHPTPDYESSCVFLLNKMKRIGLETKVVRLYPKKPFVIGCWRGLKPEKKTIACICHQDVVSPGDLTKWKHPPFSGHLDEKDGRVYGRGTQDMKSVGLGFLEAMQVLKNHEKFVPERSVFVIFTVDEETGGQYGMGKFVETEEFKKMNIGLVLDEGVPSEKKNLFYLFYSERNLFWVNFESKGKTGHGSMMLKNTAVNKMVKVMHTILEFRETQLKLLEKGNYIGETISINMNSIHAGTSLPNVIPEKAEMMIDMRVPPNISFQEVDQMIKKWCGDLATYSYRFGLDAKKYVSNVSKDYHFFRALKNAFLESKASFETKIFPASTDSFFVRRKGINAYGISLMDETQVLLHDYNEYIHKDTYLRSILIYTKMIQNMTKS